MNDYMKKRMESILNGRPLHERKKYSPIAKKSQKRIEKEKEQMDSGDKKEDDYFDYWMEHGIPICAECGMRADWLLKPQTDLKKAEMYRLMWRASQAHILPKKKNFGFPSLRNNLSNHLVLFPSWGGHLCGCHGFYDSNWYNASTMKIWPKVVEIFKQLYPLIPPKELKNIPEILLKTLELQKGK